MPVNTAISDDIEATLTSIKEAITSLNNRGDANNSYAPFDVNEKAGLFLKFQQDLMNFKALKSPSTSNVEAIYTELKSSILPEATAVIQSNNALAQMQVANLARTITPTTANSENVVFAKFQENAMALQAACYAEIQDSSDTGKTYTNTLENLTLELAQLKKS